MTAGRRTAFVTGGGSGIGRAIAVRFGRDGAAVALFDRDADAAAAVVEEVEAVGGRASLAHVGDVTHEDEVAGAIAQTAAEFGGLDAVAACAGVDVTDRQPRWRSPTGSARSQST